jgi:hypothetical protein
MRFFAATFGELGIQKAKVLIPGFLIKTPASCPSVPSVKTNPLPGKLISGLFPEGKAMVEDFAFAEAPVHLSAGQARELAEQMLKP